MQRTNSFTLDELARGQQEHSMDDSVIPPGGVAQHLAALASEHSADDSVGLATLASSSASASTSPPGSGGASPLFLPTMSPGPGGVFSCPHALAASASASATATGPMQRRRRPAARRAEPSQGPGQSEDEDDDGGSDTSSSSSLPRLSRLSVGVGPVNAKIAEIRKHLGTLRQRYISIWQLVLLAGLMQALLHYGNLMLGEPLLGGLASWEYVNLSLP